MPPIRTGPKRTTLSDVAKEAGVSVQTASHVLSGNMTVRLPESTRTKVLVAAQTVGYRPNRLAQAMKRGKSGMIAVWIPLDRPTISYMRNLREISIRANRDDVDVLIVGLMSSMAYSAEGRAPSNWPVDGVIAVDAGKALRTFREDPQNDEIPAVVLGLESYANSDSVAWDVAGAMRDATRALLAKGCKRVVQVTLDWVLRDYPREQRRRGYSEAMTEAGLEPVFIATSSETSSAAETAVQTYLQSNDIPDAFIGFTDSLAIGSARAVEAMGKRIPEDCRILGYGDYPEAEDFRIPISSLRIPVEDLTEQAWIWLKERIKGYRGAPRERILPMVFNERDSTR